MQVEDVVFAFEGKPDKPLARIPMVVRFKLDLCGVRFSLRDWAALSQEKKWVLVRQSCDSADHRDRYRRTVVELVPAHIVDANLGAESAVLLAAARNHVPPDVAEQFVRRALPCLEPGQWRALSDLQRFILTKLSREGHKNDHFIAAVEEFGLGRVAHAA